MRLKKSSLGMVLLRAADLEVGSEVLCSSIRELCKCVQGTGYFRYTNLYTYTTLFIISHDLYSLV